MAVRALALLIAGAILLTHVPAALAAGPSVGVGVSVGRRSDGSVADSVMQGAAIGGFGGPIGMAIGAGVGLLHGLIAKKQAEKQAKAEARRQQDKDREIEQEIAKQTSGGSNAPVDVASVPPDPAAGRPEPAPHKDVDDEGFRAVRADGRLVRRERVGAGGKPEVVLHYGPDGAMVRRDESTRLDGRLDTSLFYAAGTLERKESDTDADGKVDVVAFYDPLGTLTRLDTAEGDGRSRKHFDAAGAVTKEETVRADGEVTAIAYYEQGKLVRRELYEVDEQTFTRVPVVSADTTVRR